MSLVKLEIEKHTAVLTLNRPEAANALSKALLDEVNKTLTTIKQNPAIYCLIITGHGEKAFCAGADLKERKGMSEQEVIQTVQYIGETISHIEKLDIPVIAALNGVAFGGGLELALACDLRLAARHVQMGLTETSLAIIPGAGGTQRLPRLIGIGQAKQMIFTAQKKTAEEALGIGLVEHVVESEHLMTAAYELANQITKNGPVALRQAKKAMNLGMQHDVETGLAIEHLCYTHTIPTEDRREGLQAFKEKRQPNYQGK
ncbi:enoyl-CoA hydratase [Lentibacillus saliphilus]|uniref:enoyl-CoA hydratase n=1 Tax=Lentibacillus saliphilus TaxID=2737028 RepID=UPI001C2FF5ED|nr:enoyl-CoA hydratase [Lentibacillus saliphilus]